MFKKRTDFFSSVVLPQLFGEIFRTVILDGGVRAFSDRVLVETTVEASKTLF